MVAAALAGAVAAGGMFLVIVGLRDGAAPDGIRPPTRGPRIDRLLAGALIPGSAALAALAVTGWVVGAVAAAAAAVVIPRSARYRAERRRRRQVNAAVTVWVEMLRDAVAAGRGLGEALAATAGLAPLPVRAATIGLQARAARGPLPPALRIFADEVDDPTADLLAAALTLGATREVRDLADLLGTLATTSRERARVAETADAGRAGIRTTARAITAISAVAVLLFTLASPTYLSPFDGPAGQIALAVSFSLFAAGGWGLQRLGEPPAPDRLRLREVS